MGDYTLITDQSICIDTKSGLLEAAMDLGSEKTRFWRECERADKYGILLVVLIEVPNKAIRTVYDVGNWHNPFLNPANPKYNPKAMTGQRLMKRINDCRRRFGTEFVFCTPEETGQVIRGFLDNGRQ